MKPEEKLIVALDFPSLDEAKKMVRALAPAVKRFKIGKELFTAAGPEAVRMVLSHRADVFLDLKFHDIPHTVAAACEAASKLGVWMLNVHAGGGAKMLEAARRAAPETKLLGVTVLTSLSDEDLRTVGIEQGVERQVERLAELSKRCGLDGVVASAQEIGIVRRAAGKDFLIVTPGVRPKWADAGDQKRVMTPREAVDRGADYLVVGRPITQHAEPARAAKEILKEIGG